MIVLNAVKNKFLARVPAVVNKQQKHVKRPAYKSFIFVIKIKGREFKKEKLAFLD